MWVAKVRTKCSVSTRQPELLLISSSPLAAVGVDGPHGLVFGPDVNADGVPELYVTGRNSFSIVRYDGSNGQPMGSMNTSGVGALSYPENLTIGLDGMLYVASTGNNAVKKFNPLTSNY